MAFLQSQIAYTYQHLFKPILFRFEPEFIHNRFTNIGNLLGRTSITKRFTRSLFRFDHPTLSQTLHGIKFTNPVGLSAGFDKDANLVHILPDVGFGYMQVGSVTDQPYAGNPTTRLHRLPKSKALVVYYGLKNQGSDKIINKLRGCREPGFPLSISIAKTNSDSTNTDETGVADYCACYQKFVESDIGDFYTINISCPNTFGGEPFTTAQRLEKLLKKLITIKSTKPVFVKMPLNLSWKDFDSLLQVILKYKLQGVIIGNLTKVRDKNLILDPLSKDVKGGISGRPTFKLSNDLIAKTYKHYGDKLTIIGVGGIFSPADAYEKIKLGASLVQLITGMIYNGPQFIGEINYGLVDLLRRDGYTNIQEAVGAYHRYYSHQTK